MIESFSIILSAVLFYIIVCALSKKYGRIVGISVESKKLEKLIKTMIFLALIAVLILPSLINNPLITNPVANLGLLSMVFLFLSFIPGILKNYFPKLRINKALKDNGKNLGASVVVFIALHILTAILGFKTIKITGSVMATGIILGFVSLSFLIMYSLGLVFSSVSNKFPIVKSLIYPAMIFSLLHAFSLGRRFANTNGMIPFITSAVALSIIFLDTGARLDLSKRDFISIMKNTGYSAIIFSGVILAS